MDIKVLDKLDRSFYVLKVPCFQTGEGRERILFLPNTLFFSLVDYLPEEKKKDDAFHEKAFKVQQDPLFYGFVLSLVDASTNESFFGWCEKFPQYKALCKALVAFEILEIKE